MIKAAAEMRRTLENLYAAENSIDDKSTPMDRLVEDSEFQDAEPTNISDDSEENKTEE